VLSKTATSFQVASMQRNFHTWTLVCVSFVPRHRIHFVGLACDLWGSCSGTMFNEQCQFTEDTNLHTSDRLEERICIWRCTFTSDDILSRSVNSIPYANKEVEQIFISLVTNDYGRRHGRLYELVPGTSKCRMEYITPMTSTSSVHSDSCPDFCG